MTKTLGEFRECMTQQSMVIDEINSTPSHDRYVELSGPEGPFQALNEREQALRAIYILTFKHALGFWPHEASYMGD